jgi:hypothetical protein
MKETIYTIPINDAFDDPNGCPLCRLHEKLELDALEYVMGAAMMEPDVRIQTNKLGFCAKHFDNMATMGKRLPLGLVLESHLIELRQNLEKSAGNPAATCFVCDRKDNYMSAYYRNLLYIWQTDANFRDKFEKAKICFPHIGALLDTSSLHLKRKQLDVFRQAVSAKANVKLDELSTKVSAFCRSFDHRFTGQDLGDAKTAIEQTITWLTGKNVE